MGMQIDRAGTFLVRLQKWAVKQAEAPSMNVTVTMVGVVEASWDPIKKAWDHFWLETNEQGQRKYADHEVWCNVVVIKKDGQVNDAGVRQLREALNWNADFTAFKDDPEEGKVYVVMNVEQNVWTDAKGTHTNFRGSWIYSREHTPGDRHLPGRVAGDALADMNARLGSDVRAAMSRLTPPGSAPGGASPEKTPF